MRNSRDELSSLRRSIFFLKKKKKFLQYYKKKILKIVDRKKYSSDSFHHSRIFAICALYRIIREKKGKTTRRRDKRI